MSKRRSRSTWLAWVRRALLLVSLVLALQAHNGVAALWIIGVAIQHERAENLAAELWRVHD